MYLTIVTSGVPTEERLLIKVIEYRLPPTTGLPKLMMLGQSIVGMFDGVGVIVGPVGDGVGVGVSVRVGVLEGTYGVGTFVSVGGKVSVGNVPVIVGVSEGIVVEVGGVELGFVFVGSGVGGSVGEGMRVLVGAGVPRTSIAV